MIVVVSNTLELRCRAASISSRAVTTVSIRAARQLGNKLCKNLDSVWKRALGIDFCAALLDSVWKNPRLGDYCYG